MDPVIVNFFVMVANHTVSATSTCCPNTPPPPLLIGQTTLSAITYQRLSTPTSTNNNTCSCPYLPYQYPTVQSSVVVIQHLLVNPNNSTPVISPLMHPHHPPYLMSHSWGWLLKKIHIELFS